MAKETAVKPSDAELAKLFVDIETELKGFGSTKEKVEALAKTVKGFEGVDIAATLAKIEQLKASVEACQKAIRSNPKGFGRIAGVEDEEFSLCRYLSGVAMGGNFKEAKAEKEREIQLACRNKAAQQIGDDSLGGFWVPDQVVADVIGSIYARSAFINLGGAGEGQTVVTVLDGLFGGNVRIPKVEGGLVTYWLGENSLAIESINTAGDLTLNPHKAICLVKITDSMRRFGGFGFEAMLRRDMQRSFAEKLDWTIPYGSGSNDQPKGIASQHGIKIYSAQSNQYGVYGTDLLDGAKFQADWSPGRDSFNDYSGKWNIHAFPCDPAYCADLLDRRLSTLGAPDARGFTE